MSGNKRSWILKREPGLAKIAEWCNQATPEESAWVPFVWWWFERNILSKLHQIEGLEEDLIYDLYTGELLDIVVDQPLPRHPESDTGVIDPRTGCRLVLDSSLSRREIKKRSGIVGPAMIDGVPLDAPPLEALSRRKLSDILVEIFALWKETENLVRNNLRRRLADSSGPDFFPDDDISPEVSDLLKEEELLDRYLSHPRLKRCPVCKDWFAVSKTDQKYCTSDRYPPCREVASRGKPGEDSDRRTRYLESQSQKMALRRDAAKKAKEREAEKRRKTKLRDIKKRNKLSRRVKDK
jgi:hypothetical protein